MSYIPLNPPSKGDFKEVWTVELMGLYSLSPDLAGIHRFYDIYAAGLIQP